MKKLILSVAVLTTLFSCGGGAEGDGKGGDSTKVGGTIKIDG